MGPRRAGSPVYPADPEHDHRHDKQYALPALEISASRPQTDDSSVPVIQLSINRSRREMGDP
jgi:hypothetical protein